MKRGRTKRLMKRAGKSSLALLPGLVYSWVFFVVPLLILFRWYKISIAPEADMKPRRLCLFLL